MLARSTENQKSFSTEVTKLVRYKPKDACGYVIYTENEEDWHKQRKAKMEKEQDI